MKNNNEFEQLLHEITSIEKIEASVPVLRALLSKPYNIENVVYLGMNIPGQDNKPLLSVTYSSEWQRHYAQRGYIDIDPVVRSGLGGILPIDWRDINREDPFIKQFFEEATELNIGRNGLTIPLRGRYGDFALFTVTSNVSNEIWNNSLSELKRDMMIIAWNFHAQIVMLSVKNNEPQEIKLSQRELLCLRWKALGKTENEIAEIIGIAPRTVSFHLEGARARLFVNNVTHAVSKALALGKINIWYEPYAIIKGK